MVDADPDQGFRDSEGEDGGAGEVYTGVRGRESAAGWAVGECVGEGWRYGVEALEM